MLYQKNKCTNCGKEWCGFLSSYLCPDCKCPNKEDVVNEQEEK